MVVFLLLIELRKVFMKMFSSSVESTRGYTGVLSSSSLSEEETYSGSTYFCRTASSAMKQSSKRMDGAYEL